MEKGWRNKFFNINNLVFSGEQNEFETAKIHRVAWGLYDNPGNWSFINEKEKFIIFGAWESKTNESGETLIFSKSWEFKSCRKSGNYKKSREHIRMIEDGDFKLKTFAMVDGRSEEEQRRDTKAAWIKDFTRELENKTLRRDGDKDWYADPIEFSSPAIKFPDEANIDPNALYPEGAIYTIQVNGYERNREARQRCLDHHGYSCAVCGLISKNITVTSEKTIFMYTTRLQYVLSGKSIGLIL